MDTANDRVTALRQQLAELQKLFCTSNARASAVQLELSASDARATTLQLQLDASNELVVILQQHLDSTSDHVTTLKQENSSLRMLNALYWARDVSNVLDVGTVRSIPFFWYPSGKHNIYIIKSSFCMQLALSSPPKSSTTLETVVSSESTDSLSTNSTESSLSSESSS